MKISIGVRLFFAVLLSIIAVASVALLLMREKVSASFSDYAVRIELERLREVSEALQEHYADQKNWNFLPADAPAKRAWVSQELLRLSEKKAHKVLRERDAPHVGKIAAASSKSATAMPLPESSENTRIVAPERADLPPLPPPVPPVPPMPPLPPPPPVPPVPPILRDTINWFSLGDKAEHTNSRDGEEAPSLFSRITVLDHDQNYLAGRVLDDLPGTARPLFLDNTLIGYLRVTKTGLPGDAMAKDFLQEQTDTILIIVVVSISLSALAASLLAWHFRRPIRTLVQGSQRLADGHLDTRLPAGRSDELGNLAHSFNQLAERLEQAQTSRRQWVADTSHELRTPISVLRAQLEAIQDGIRSASPEHIALMLRQVLSLNKLIDELYQLARFDIGDLQYQMQSVELWSLVEEETLNFKEKIATAQLQLRLNTTGGDLRVHADPDRLRQVLINLLENAVRYTDAGGSILIRAELTKKNVCIVIEDSAPAVPEAALQRLSERFFRVDTSRNRQQGGAGLGLALCARIVSAHGGELGFSHSSLGGLCVRLSLPLETV